MADESLKSLIIKTDEIGDFTGLFDNTVTYRIVDDQNDVESISYYGDTSEKKPGLKKNRDKKNRDRKKPGQYIIN